MSHYFTNDNNLKSEKIVIEDKFNNKEYKFISDNGVFSKDELDYGSKALLNVLIKEDLKGSLLDLGCGYGFIGIVLKKEFDKLAIDMVDVNLRALELSKHNCNINNVDNNIFESDGFKNTKKKYNVIVTNPPIRAGKETIYEFFEEGYKNLEENGLLYVVMRKNHGAKSSIDKLNDIFGNCCLLKKDKGFYIFKSCKHLTKK